MNGPGTVAPGATIRLRLTAFYNDGSEQDKTADAAWSVSNTSVATGGQGQIAGRTAGEAFVSARFGNREAQREIVVVPDGTFRVTGYVFESDGGPVRVAFAHVQVRDGSSVGPSTDADFNGFFKLYGVKRDADIVTSGAGYSETVKHVTIDRHSHINLELPPAGAQQQYGGTYTVTFNWSRCSPRYVPELAQRVYAAVITQTGSELAIRFTDPNFMRNPADLGNRMEGRLFPGGVALLADYGFYYYYTKPSDLPMLVEILPDNKKLVTSGTVRATNIGSGFAGEIDGGVALYEERFPRGGWIAACSAGNVRFDRR